MCDCMSVYRGSSCEKINYGDINQYLRQNPQYNIIPISTCKLLKIAIDMDKEINKTALDPTKWLYRGVTSKAFSIMFKCGSCTVYKEYGFSSCSSKLDGAKMFTDDNGVILHIRILGTVKGYKYTYEKYKSASLINEDEIVLQRNLAFELGKEIKRGTGGIRHFECTVKALGDTCITHFYDSQHMMDAFRRQQLLAGPRELSSDDESSNFSSQEAGSLPRHRRAPRRKLRVSPCTAPRRRRYL